MYRLSKADSGHEPGTFNATVAVLALGKTLKAATEALDVPPQEVMHAVAYLAVGCSGGNPNCPFRNKCRAGRFQ